MAAHNAIHRLLSQQMRVVPRRTFYHFHGNPKQVVRVPSPLSVARLTKMGYKINGMMELRDITATERIKHLHLRRRRSKIIEEHGHRVQEVDFPVLQVSELAAWTEFSAEVKSTLLAQLEIAGLVQDQVLSRPVMSLLLEEEATLAEITSHPVLQPQKENIERWLNSIAIGLPDWMYFANTEGLALGQSELIDDRPVRLIWKARHIERQAETAAAVRQALSIGEVPIIYLKGSDEGRADWGETNVPGTWIGFHSSRTDPALYDSVQRLLRALEVHGRSVPRKVVEVEVKKEIPGLPDLQNTFYHKDLTCLYVPGTASHHSSRGSRRSGEKSGEGSGSTVALVRDAVTPESIARLEAAGVDVTPIPLDEGLAQGLNSVLLWGEGHGGAQGTSSVALMPPGCPILSETVSSRGFRVKPLEFGSPAGGGNWECETNFALNGFSPLLPEAQKIYARMGNRLLERANLDGHFRFICSSDLQGFSWSLDTGS